MTGPTRARSRRIKTVFKIVPAIGLLTLIFGPNNFAGEPRQSVSRVQADRQPRVVAGRRSSSQTGPLRSPVPWDDGTYRATVVVRRGTSQGSGTIIASLDGETLVLTAAHVVKTEGPVLVELHRYNLGLERRPATPGVWPRVVSARLVASDAAADVSVLRIRKLAALPYVARLNLESDDVRPDAAVVSIGVDLGRKLTHWSSRLLEKVRFELNDSGSSRLFLITEKIPEHGRSGGGLFLPSGELVGICVGHSELVKGKRLGVFAAGASISRLLDDEHLTDTVVRSELRLARLRKDRLPKSRASSPAEPSLLVTPTQSAATEADVRTSPRTITKGAAGVPTSEAEEEKNQPPQIP